MGEGRGASNQDATMGRRVKVGTCGGDSRSKSGELAATCGLCRGNRRRTVLAATCGVSSCRCGVFADLGDGNLPDDHLHAIAVSALQLLLRLTDVLRWAGARPAGQQRLQCQALPTDSNAVQIHPCTATSFLGSIQPTPPASPQPVGAWTQAWLRRFTVNMCNDDRSHGLPLVPFCCKLLQSRANPPRTPRHGVYVGQREAENQLVRR